MSDPGPALAFATTDQLIHELETRMLLARTSDTPMQVALTMLALAGSHGAVIACGYTTANRTIKLTLHGDSLSCLGMLAQMETIYRRGEDAEDQTA